MSTVHSIPCGIVDVLTGYLCFFVKLRGLALGVHGGTYLGVSAVDTLVLFAESSTCDVDGPSYSTTSSSSYTQVLFVCFFGTWDLGR